MSSAKKEKTKIKKRVGLEAGAIPRDLRGKTYLKHGIIDQEPLIPARELAAAPLLALQLRCCEVNLGGMCRFLIDTMKGDGLQFRDSHTFFKRSAKKILLDFEAKYSTKTVEWRNLLLKAIPADWSFNDSLSLIMLDKYLARKNEQTVLSGLFTAAVSVIRGRHRVRYNMSRKAHDAAGKRTQTVMKYFKREDAAFDVIAWLLERHPAVALMDWHKQPTAFYDKLAREIEDHHPTVELNSIHSAIKRFSQIAHLEARSFSSLTAHVEEESILDATESRKPQHHDSHLQHAMGNHTATGSLNGSVAPITEDRSTDDEDSEDEDEFYDDDYSFDVIKRIHQLHLDLRTESLRWHSNTTAMVMTHLQRDRMAWNDLGYLYRRTNETLASDVGINAAKQSFATIQSDLEKQNALLKESVQLLNNILEATDRVSQRVSHRVKTILVRTARLDNSTQSQKLQSDREAGFSTGKLTLPMQWNSTSEKRVPPVRLPSSAFPTALPTLVASKRESWDEIVAREREAAMQGQSPRAARAAALQWDDSPAGAGGSSDDLPIRLRDRRGSVHASMLGSSGESMEDIARAAVAAATAVAAAERAASVAAAAGGNAGGGGMLPSEMRQLVMNGNGAKESLPRVPVAVRAALLRKCIALSTSATDEDVSNLLHDPMTIGALDHYTQFEGNESEVLGRAAAKQRAKATARCLRSVGKAIRDPAKTSSLRVSLPSGTRLGEMRIRTIEEIPDSPGARRRVFGQLSEALLSEASRLEHRATRAAHPKKATHPQQQQQQQQMSRMPPPAQHHGMFEPPTPSKHRKHSSDESLSRSPGSFASPTPIRADHALSAADMWPADEPKLRRPGKKNRNKTMQSDDSHSSDGQHETSLPSLIPLSPSSKWALETDEESVF